MGGRLDWAAAESSSHSDRIRLIYGTRESVLWKFCSQVRDSKPISPLQNSFTLTLTKSARTPVRLGESSGRGRRVFRRSLHDRNRGPGRGSEPRSESQASPSFSKSDLSQIQETAPYKARAIPAWPFPPCRLDRSVDRPGRGVSVLRPHRPA